MEQGAAAAVLPGPPPAGGAAQRPQDRFLPAELVELLIHWRYSDPSFTSSKDLTREVATHRLVGKAWLRAANETLTRVRVRDYQNALGPPRPAGFEDLVAHLTARYPKLETLDLGVCYAEQLLVGTSPAELVLDLGRFSERLGRWALAWPTCHLVLRAGVRTLSDPAAVVLLRSSPVFSNVVGIVLFKDFRTTLPPTPVDVDGEVLTGDALCQCLQRSLGLLGSQLKELVFEHLEVESLEQCRALSTLTQLTSLEFRGGVLTQLPSHLSSLAELRSLTLDDCHLRIRGHVGKHLKRLPSAASKLRRRTLTRLAITHSHLAMNIKPILGLHLSRLTHLDLSHNKLGALPSTLGKLAQLEYLDVSHNSLVSVPNDLALCRQLWFLAMAHNKIKHLPPLQQLFFLQELDVSFNALTELPVQLPSLKHVRRLDVRNNPLRVPLPREMVVFLHRVQDARYDAHVAPPARANG